MLVVESSLQGASTRTSQPNKVQDA
jgi:hypothetical protein